MTPLRTPTGRFIGRWASGSPEWHAARRQRIGGSTIAAILGLSPWESPFSVWCQMAGLADPPPQTKAQERGHYLEPAVAAWFADQHPDWKIVEAGTYVHAERDWQLANPDRLIIYPGDDGCASAVLEIKTAADDAGWGRPGTDEIPVYYRTQVQWYLDTLGLQRAYVAVLTGRLRFAEYVVDYDPADAAIMRDHAEEFLAALLWGEKPDLDSHPATYTTLQQLHPQIDNTTVDLDDATAAEYIEAYTEHKRAEARLNAARARLAAAMGTARAAKWRDQVIATRQAKNGGTPHLVTASKLPDPSTWKAVA